MFKSKRPFDPKRFWDYLQQKFPDTIIRSKGLFWLASRPQQALVWGQAGGSLKADSAGVWWSSMSFNERTQNNVFLDNQDEIESDWHKEFGDRKNEIVFIGQHINQIQIKKDLSACLSTFEELDSQKWKTGFDDNWPVERVYAI